MSELVRSHRELRVYQLARSASSRITRLASKFPAFERYALTSQILRSSRSVYANITEAWRKRRYKKSFIAKLSDAETEAAETQEWLETALEEGYIDAHVSSELQSEYEKILGGLVRMIVTADSWVIPKGTQTTPTHRHSDTPIR